MNDFKMIEGGRRKVYQDCHIFVKRNYYSVPFEYIGKEIEIELSKTLLKVYYNNKEIAVHARLSGGGEFSTINNHYPKYKRYSDTEYQEIYQAKMAEVGSYAEQIFFAIAGKQPRDWGKPVRGILSLLKKYPKEIVDLGCKRALAFNVYKYSTVKNICANGSYVLPLEFDIEEVEHEYA